MAFRLNYNVEARDPGRTVWSCHSGSIEGDLDTLRGLAAALQLPDLWEDITDAADVIQRGDAADGCFTVRYTDEADFRLDMDLEVVA